LLTALSTSDYKEGEKIDRRRRRRSIVLCSRRLHSLSSDVYALLFL
jgi:hypothetical protein